MEIRKLLRLQVFLAWLAVMLIQPDGLRAQDISSYPIDDAIVAAAYPDSVINQADKGNNILTYREVVDGDTLRVMSFVKFDISKLKGTQLSEASFSYRGKVTNADFDDVFLLDLLGTKGDFYGDTLTWGTKPSTGSKLATSFLNSASDRKAFENEGSALVDYINEEIRKGSETVSFIVRSTGDDVTNTMWMGGQKNGSYAPVLDYTISSENSQYPIDDAIVAAAYPDSVINQADKGNNILMYREVVEGDTLRVMSFVKFDISKLKGTQLSEASFSYRGKVTNADFDDVFLLELMGTKGDFYGDTLTWGTKPSTGSKLATSFLNSASDRKAFENDGSALIDYINEEIRKGSETVSFIVRSTGEDVTNTMWMGGQKNGNYAPVLDYTISPDNSQYPIDDAIVAAAYPDSVINQADKGNNILTYREVVEGDTLRVMSFVKFDIGKLKGTQLSEASFSYRGKVTNADFDDVFLLDLLGVKGDFYGDTLTWGNKPSTGSKLATSFLNSASDRKAFENEGSALVDYINEEIRKGSETVSFIVRSTGDDVTNTMWMGGQKNGNYAPVLDYTISPDNSQYPIDDAIVAAAFPDSVINQADKGNNILMYREVVEGDTLRVMSFVKFDVSHMKGLQLSDASFSYRGKVTNADFDDVFLLELMGTKGDFYGDTLTWGTKPSTGSKLATSFLNSASDRKAFENEGSALIDYINEELRKGSETVSFIVRSAGDDVTNTMWMGGQKNGNYAPVLDFTTGSIFVASDDSTQVISDAYVDEALPDDNFGAEADMHIHKKEAGNKEVYIKFDISDKEELAGDVDLKFYVAQHNSGTQEESYMIEVLPTGNAWSEDTLTWSNKTTPEDNVLLEADVTNFGAGQYYYLNNDAFTNYINAAILEGKDTVSFVVRAKDAKDGRLWTAGKEWKNESWLVFKYSTPAPKQRLKVKDDAYVAEATPNDNFGGEADMHIINEADGQKEVYLRYNLNDVRAGEAVNAGLDIYIAQHNSGAGLEDYYVNVYGVKNEWAEDSLNWNNKPETTTDALIEENVKNFGSGEYRVWTSEAMTEFVNEAMKQKKDYVSFVVKGRDETPGNRLWTAGKEWKNDAALVLSYDPIVATPTFSEEAGDYIDSLNVQISTTTAGAEIYYTLDGTEPNNASSPYDAELGIIMESSETDSLFTLKVVAYADGLNPSIVVTQQYNVLPVSSPIFSPNPLVEYQDEVVVTLTAEPADALIFYTDVEGEDPATPYPAGGIVLNATSTIKAVAVNGSGSYTSPAVEATFKVVTTVAGTGTGPGGVGASDNTISGQPENALWLKADAISAADGDAITMWEDASGNANNAYNDYVEGGDNNILNTTEKQKPAPTYVASGLNNLPILDFGKPEDGEDLQKRSMIVDDADNLDGGAGISIFMVFKRNEMFADFAAVLQKRDFTGGDATKQAYTLEFDGGSNPHRLQFVIARDIFLKQNVDEVNADDYYIINVELQGDFQQALFRTNGELLSNQVYKNIIQSVDATMIIGGFQPMNIAEVIIYKKGLNAAQNKIVHNYLASKWGLPLVGGNAYTSTEFTGDIIGIGTDTYIDNTTEQSHNSASGGGLQIEIANTFASGDYVLAGHNNAAINNEVAWERTWNVEATNSGLNVKMSFDFEAAGLSAPTSADDYKLWFDDGNGFTDSGLSGTLDGNLISFTVENIVSGIYGIGSSQPSAVAAPVFSVAGGEYDVEQSVEITSSTEGASIFYTTDGTDPSASSTAYTGAITIAETTVLKAVAILDGESSGITEATYTIGATGLNYEDISSQLSVFPNPANSQIGVSFQNEAIGDLQVRLLDFTGKEVFVKQLQKQSASMEFVIPLNKVTNGLYLVEIIQGKQRAVRKVLKQ